MNRDTNTIDKLNKKSSRLRIIGLLLIILSFITFIIFTKHQGNEIETQNNIITNKDSVLTAIKDSTSNILSKKDSLISIVTELFRLRNEHKADSIELLYSDTVKSYFKNLKNVSKNIITKSDKQYWTKYKSDNFNITDPIQIVIDSLGDKAIVKGRQCYDEKRCYDEIVEIGFDLTKKINYVRAFYDTK
jgi:hypothetical protein